MTLTVPLVGVLLLFSLCLLLFWPLRFTSIVPLIHQVSASIAAQDYPIQASEEDTCHG